LPRGYIYIINTVVWRGWGGGMLISYELRCWLYLNDCVIEELIATTRQVHFSQKSFFDCFVCAITTRLMLFKNKVFSIVVYDDYVEMDLPRLFYGQKLSKFGHALFL